LLPPFIFIEIPGHPAPSYLTQAQSQESASKKVMFKAWGEGKQPAWVQ